ncbi:MAG: NosD domain-containing protein [Candidatus Bathyarchaeia archaeon]
MLALLLIGMSTLEVNIQQGKAEPLTPLLWSYSADGWEGVASVAISDDGGYVATGSRDGRVHFFHKSSGMPLWSFQTEGEVLSVAISNDGSYIAAGSWDGNVYLFHRDSDIPLWNSSIHVMYDVSISGDGNYIVAGCLDGRVYLFHKSSPDPLWNCEVTSPSMYLYVAISDDGNYIIVGSYRTVYFFHSSNNVPLWIYEVAPEILSVSISGDGNYAAVGNYAGIYLFDRRGTEIWRFQNGGNVHLVSITDDGSYIAEGDYDGMTYLFRSNSNVPVWSYYTQDWVESVSISLDGNYIASGVRTSLTHVGYVFLFNNDGASLWSYETEGGVYSVSTSIGGYVAAGSNDDLDRAHLYFFGRPEPTTWTVDDDGPADFHTIQEAINAANPGDIIYVYNGTYNEHVVANKTVSLLGENRSSTIIDGGRAPIVVDVTANNVVVSGFTIFNGGKGIRLWNSTDSMIGDNYVMINDYGIYVDKSPNNTIIGNMIGGIQGVRISEYGIALYSSPNTSIIENIIFTNNKEGILIEFSSNTKVIQNIILTSREGIRISHSSNNFISQNNITNNRDYGIQAIQSHNNTIIRNTITNTSELFMSKPGITFSDSHFNRIIQNKITNNYIGVAVASSSLNTISGNNISSNDYVGIRFDYPWTNYNEVSGNIVSNNDYGIFLASSANNNTIFGNYITNNNRGIYLSGTSNNMFFHNNFVENTQQVVSYDSTNLWDDGYPSGGNYWSDHVCVGNPSNGSQPYIIDAENIDHYPFQDPNGWLKVHNIDTGLDYETIQEAIDASETLDGHTILVDAGTYYEHVTVYKSLTLIGESKNITVIDGGGTSTVVHIAVNNVNLSEFTIQNSGKHYPGWIGILMDFSNRSTISNNILLNNYFGILLSGSSENSISDNTISSSYIGIFLEYTHLNESTGNIIIRNTISNNEYGIGIEECSGNTIYHNNFINNTIQAGVSVPHLNTWDNGYPSGGNYWSDYSIIYPIVRDEYQGENQNIPGGDGIWDHPYEIDVDNIDDYPLVEPWTPLPPIPTTIHELKTEIEELGLQGEIDNQGIVKSLLAKLNVAQKLGDKGKIDEAKSVLEEAFILQVQNLSSIHITLEAAEILIKSAEHIISHL